MLQIWKSYPLGLVPFTLLYLAAACIGAVRTGNGEFLFYIAVLVALIAAVSFLHFRVRLSAGVLWGLSAWGLAHMAGGLLPVPAIRKSEASQRFWEVCARNFAQ